MTRPAVRITREGRVTILTLDRPAVRNALDLIAQRELANALDAFAADDEQWVAILTGAGADAFCAGFDLCTPAPNASDELPCDGFGGLTARFDLDKPVIAAVNGLAIGGGFEMILACDIVVAAPHARFALPEVRVGVAALGGGILRLPAAIGRQRAMAMLLTGRGMEVAEAVACGLVSEVAPAEVLLDCARRWAGGLIANSPLAVRATKAVARVFGSDVPLERAMAEQWHHPAVRRLLSSDDAREGAAAFRDRRAPVWNDP